MLFYILFWPAIFCQVLMQTIATTIDRVSRDFGERFYCTFAHPFQRDNYMVVVLPVSLVGWIATIWFLVFLVSWIAA